MRLYFVQHNEQFQKLQNCTANITKRRRRERSHQQTNQTKQTPSSSSAQNDISGIFCATFIACNSISRNFRLWKSVDVCLMFFFFFHFGIYTFQSQRSLFSRIYFSIFVDILACNSLYCSLAAQCAQVIFSWCCNLRETGLQGDLWRAMAR